MLTFRNAVAHKDLNHWTSSEDLVAFSRGRVGFFAMTSASNFSGLVNTGKSYLFFTFHKSENNLGGHAADCSWINIVQNQEQSPRHTNSFRDLSNCLLFATRNNMLIVISRSSGLAAGTYCDILSDCSRQIVVKEDGSTQLDIRGEANPVTAVIASKLSICTV